MRKRRKNHLQDIRQKQLFYAFCDINYNFADWYQATQLEIDRMEQELTNRLLPGHL